jgi:hypothetical protein
MFVRVIHQSAEPMKTPAVAKRAVKRFVTSMAMARDEKAAIKAKTVTGLVRVRRNIPVKSRYKLWLY